MWRVCLLLGASACGRVAFDQAPGPTNDASCGDATFFDACLASTGQPGSMVLGSGVYTYDTTTGELRSPAGALQPHDNVVDSSRTPPVRIAMFASLTIAAPAALQVYGTMPLAIVGRSTVSIAGLLDSNGGVGEVAGAGSTACDAIAMQGGADSGGGAGGGGGGFGGAGGAGGSGDIDDDSLPVGPSAGGLGGPLMAATSLRGGCSGGGGGAGQDPGGRGGFGGGGLLVSAPSVVIGGTVRVNGQGGRPCPLVTGGDGGGGGGGSGGMLVLAGVALTLDGAILVANGGGGAEGTENSLTGVPGTSGVDSAIPAAGGAGASVETTDDGGSGGSRTSLAAAGAPSSLGGAGGGGGGVGVILVQQSATTTLSGAVVSPAAQPF